MMVDEDALCTGCSLRGQWCHRVQWNVLWILAEGPHDQWWHDWQPLLRGPLMLVGDGSVDEAQKVWGLGAVLATMEGCVL